MADGGAFVRAETILEVCREHVKATGTAGEPIEHYLAQHVLVTMCAEMQQSLYAVVEARAAGLGDAGAKEFVRAAIVKLIRSVRTSELKGIAKMWGPDCGERFKAALDEAEETLYNNTVGDRHDVAHRSGAQVTLGDLDRALKVAAKVVCAFEESIAVRS